MSFVKKWWALSWRYLGMGALFTVVTSLVVAACGAHETWWGRSLIQFSMIPGMAVGFWWTCWLIDRGHFYESR